MGELIEIDIRGQICPSCLLIALKEVNERGRDLRVGAVELRVLTSDRQSTATIPQAVSNMGYGVRVRKREGHYEVIIGAPS
ncbi:MAG: sulfurtransferase TusA family protein [Chromatiales bacterium]|jgi:TusA-related sulfurtransferase